jgi:hypothetical protein
MAARLPAAAAGNAVGGAERIDRGMDGAVQPAGGLQQFHMQRVVVWSGTHDVCLERGLSAEDRTKSTRKY